MGTESLVGWDLLTQSGNMAKDCDATAMVWSARLQMPATL